MQKIEYVEGFKVVHVIPDYTEEQKEEIRQNISQKIYYLFSNRMIQIDTKVKTNYNCKKKAKG